MLIKKNHKLYLKTTSYLVNNIEELNWIPTHPILWDTEREIKEEREIERGKGEKRDLENLSSASRLSEFKFGRSEQ